MSTLVVALSEKLDEQQLYDSLIVAFRCLPNGFGSHLIHLIKEYLMINLEEFKGSIHSVERIEELRRSGFKIYELNLDDDDCDWIVSLMYQNEVNLRTSRMHLLTYTLGEYE